jgi:hypothetical protein
MKGTSLKNLILGFVAGAIASVTVGELIKYGLYTHGYVQTPPWSVEPTDLLAMPQIVSDMLWGGVWGAIFALVLGNAPVGSMTVRGAILGIFGPAILGIFLLRPYFRGEAALLGGDPTLLGSVLLIMAGFGAATAWLYGFMTAGFRLPD